jgi:hypothetical protein
MLEAILAYVLYRLACMQCNGVIEVCYAGWLVADAFGFDVLIVCAL